MRSSVLRRATLVALTALLAVAAVTPVAADSRPRKAYPTHQERYRVGRAMTPSTDVLSVSGYAAWMIDEALAGTTPLPRVGAAFLRAERTYGVNARYFVAHALLESGWGSSAIARYKRNLFGYNAFDRNPWKYASSFRTFEQGIMTVAERVRDSYLTPGGRFFYRFTTLRAMNVYYASDPNWAAKIAHIANVLDRLVVTLRERGLQFGSPSLAGPARAGAGVALDVPWTARRGAVLPGGVRFAVRWTPLALAEADAAAPGAAPEARWELVSRRSRTGRVVRLAARAPSEPGLWRLDVEARDSDGEALPETDRPAIRPLTVRVTGPQEAALAVAATEKGRLAVTIRNVGTRPLAAWRAGTSTAVEAWALPLDPDRPAYRLAARELGSALRPGATRVLRFAPPRDPAIVVVRLAGDAGAVGRSRPVAVLVARGEGRHVEVTELPVASPRDDVLAGREPGDGRVAIGLAGDPGTVRVIVEPSDGAGPVAAGLAAMETPPGSPTLLVRSLAAEPARPAEPSGSLAGLAVDQARRVTLDITGLPAGVRLVVAGLLPPDGGPLDVGTARLAWVPVVPVPDAAAAPH